MMLPFVYSTTAPTYRVSSRSLMQARLGATSRVPVIESGFGTFDPFNKLVRSVFNDKIGVTKKAGQRMDQVAPHAWSTSVA